MVTETPEVRIQLWLFERIWVATFGIFISGCLAFAGVRMIQELEAESIPFLMMAGALFIFGAWFSYRQIRMGVTSCGDLLTVRNGTQTTEFLRSEINDFKVIGPFGGGIAVAPQDGDLLRIEICSRFGAMRRRKRRARQLAELHAWLAAGG